VELHIICLNAEMYTYVTSVATEGAENPQAASWVDAVIAVEAAAIKLFGTLVTIFVPPVVGNVAGNALVSSGPLKAPK
jgi:hypothetical protein